MHENITREKNLRHLRTLNVDLGYLYIRFCMNMWSSTDTLTSRIAG